MSAEFSQDRLGYFPAFTFKDIPYIAQTIDRARTLSKIPGYQVLKEYEQGMKSAFEKRNGVPVLVCAYNEEDNLPRLLFALSESKLSIRPIIINNGSTDGTENIAKTLNIELVQEEKPGLVYAKMAGFRYIQQTGLTSQTVLSTDADGLPGINWSQKMQGLGDTLPNNGGQLFGTYLYYGGKELGSDFMLSSVFHAKGFIKYYLHGTVSAHGCANFAIKFDENKKIIEAVQKLDTNITIGNDGLLRDSIRMSGGKIERTLNPQTLVLTKSDKYPDRNSVLMLLLKRGIMIRKQYKKWFERKPGVQYTG